MRDLGCSVIQYSTCAPVGVLMYIQIFTVLFLSVCCLVPWTSKVSSEMSFSVTKDAKLWELHQTAVCVLSRLQPLFSLKDFWGGGGGGEGGGVQLWLIWALSESELNLLPCLKGDIAIYKGSFFSFELYCAESDRAESVLKKTPDAWNCFNIFLSHDGIRWMTFEKNDNLVQQSLTFWSVLRSETDECW